MIERVVSSVASDDSKRLLAELEHLNSDLLSIQPKTDSDDLPKRLETIATLCRVFDSIRNFEANYMALEVAAPDVSAALRSAYTIWTSLLVQSSLLSGDDGSDSAIQLKRRLSIANEVLRDFTRAEAGEKRFIARMANQTESSR